MLYENEEDTLEEMEQWRTNSKKKDFSSVMSKRKISKFEMDDYFMGG